MASRPELVIFVHTGDRINSGTRNKVRIVLHSDHGTSSNPIILNSFFSNRLEKDKIETYQVKSADVANLEWDVNIERIEVFKSSFLGCISDDWFVHKIVVDNTGTNSTFVFPFFRWLKSGPSYSIMCNDTSLPQYDPFGDQRQQELQEKKKAYSFRQKIPDGPVQVKKLPPAEQFSFSYTWDIVRIKAEMTTVAKVDAIFSKEVNSIEDLKNVYNSDHLERPRNVDNWNLDTNFGRQRMSGLNPTMIRVVKEIPDKFPVTDALLGNMLENMTIAEAIGRKRLFITDYKSMEGMPTKRGFVVCKPIGLFFLNERDILLPVAIQLFQQPGDKNPIFTPEDNPMIWNYVKMWYNNADAGYHQSLIHLGSTHLMMEGFCLATHRNLSHSHPVFKLLSHHFLYLLGINQNALDTLVAEGGWVDQIMNVGSKGLLHLVRKGLEEWRLDVQGLLPEDLKERGFDDPDMLPGYYYRDDGLMLYHCISQYTKDYVTLYYNSDEILKEDTEIQAWAYELVKERDDEAGGCGYKGIPGNGQLSSLDDLAKILTCIVFTCSVTHGAVNFPQYDEYGFPPNFPSFMKGTPPTSKNVVITERDLMASLPDREETLDIMTMSTILSNKGTNSLGDFDVQYIFDPEALQVVDKFRENLRELSRKIKERNNKVFQPYDYLDPANVPNAISI